MRRSQLDFLCACDEHLHHGVCADDCLCIQQVRRDADRTTPAGHFAVITTYVWLHNGPPRSGDTIPQEGESE